ncbi:MAG TPA: hypothetical protein ENH11_03800 [Candidatus Acetothermia bacterium]|nr:hypothetical protein [Candidatus Acetothermia bacterium]
MVKAFPQPSQKHEETVCCAGVTEDGQALLRLFPIRYRRLGKDDQFDRFDLVEMTITKASDPRPESYRVDEASIHRLERGKQLADAAKVRLWAPFIAPSLKGLMAENADNNRSLGIIKPDPDSLKFVVKEAAQSEQDDQAVAKMVFEQASLLEGLLKPIEKPRYSFSYHYTCAGHPHKHQIHDWEVQAAFNHYKRRYKTEDEALKMMQQEYGQNIPRYNLHFIMGTMASHPRTFIVIGLLRSKLDPEEVNKQGVLDLQKAPGSGGDMPLLS